MNSFAIILWLLYVSTMAKITHRVCWCEWKVWMIIEDGRKTDIERIHKHVMHNTNDEIRIEMSNWNVSKIVGHVHTQIRLNIYCHQKLHHQDKTTLNYFYDFQFWSTRSRLPKWAQEHNESNPLTKDDKMKSMIQIFFIIKLATE